MRDPYEVLGLQHGASEQQVKTAYRNLAKKYHPDNYSGSPLQDVANEKMQEINEAYDSIINGKGDFSNSSNPFGSGYSSYANPFSSYRQSSYGSAYSSVDYSYVINLINQGRIDDAEVLLENMQLNLRDAKWYFLKGKINYNRGWIDQAKTYFATAYKMEPTNAEYRNAYESISAQRNGAYRTSSRNSSVDCGDIFCGLCCADSCCECMGGDLISCC